MTFLTKVAIQFALLSLLRIESTTSFNCIGHGYYPKPALHGCVDYVVCSISKDIQKSTQDFRCPTGTVYNSTSLQCETNECSVHNKTIPLKPHPRKAKATFFCTARGRFPNPEVPECGGYIYCSKKSKNNYVQYHYTCPKGQKFDPVEEECRKKYTCPKKPTSFRITTPPKISKSNENKCNCKNENTAGQNLFGCTEVGRIPDSSILDCRGYIMCSNTPNGTLTGGRFLCAAGTRFDPFRKSCQYDYDCKQAQAFQSDAIVVEAITSTTTPTSIITTTSASTTPRTTATTTTTTESPRPFECPSVGRFLDSLVPKCKGYILCLASPTPGIFGRYTCLGETAFNPALQECSLNYKCPY